jgi:cell division protein FtsB
MSSVPNQISELRAQVEKITARVEQLERENALWRDAFSRGSLPAPRALVTAN